jgi:hypothetical protein
MKGNEHDDFISEFADILDSEDFKNTMKRFRKLEATRNKRQQQSSEKSNVNLLSLERAVNEKRKKSYSIF